MRKQTKIAALVSAAALLAIGASMTSFAAGWTYDNTIGHYVYEDSDGYRLTNEWVKWRNPYNANDPGNGKWCYLGDDGVALRDQLVPYGEFYYFVDEDGYRVLNEWRYIDNEEGEEVNGVVPSGLWYYFQATNGHAWTGTTKKIDNQTIRFDENGRVVAGWYTEDNETWYYYNDQVDEKDHTYGAAANGWVKMAANPDNPVDVTEDGQDATEVDYYFDAGKMITGSKYMNKTWYYFDENTGALQSSKWTLVEDDNAKNNVGVASGAYIYADANGHKETGWIYASDSAVKDKSETASDNWFYLDKKGLRYTAEGTNATGKAKKAYAADSTATDVALAKINGKFYLFDSVGRMLHGLYEITAPVTAKLGSDLKLEKGIYYFDDGDNAQGGKNGWMITNSRYATTDDYDNETNYYFDRNGMAYEDAIVGGAYYADATYGTDSRGKRVDAYDDYTEVKVTEEKTRVVSSNSSSYLKADGYILVNDKGAVQKKRTVKNVAGYKTYYVGKVPTKSEIKTALKNGQTIDADYVKVDVATLLSGKVIANMSNEDLDKLAGDIYEKINTAVNPTTNKVYSDYHIVAVID